MTAFPAVMRSQRTGLTQGRVAWPHDARCVVTFTIDFDGPSNDAGLGRPPLGMHSLGRYSARRGVPRHLAMLQRLGIPATFFVPGYDAECYPEVMRQITAGGHEIAAHGYVHERSLYPPDEEERRLTKTHHILSDLLGRPPVGWRSPGGQKSGATLPVLHRLGYRYDSSDKDFDMPYMLDVGGGRSMVEIPNNTFSLDDFPWFNYSATPTSEVVAEWHAEFDAIYADRGYFMLTVHPRSHWGSGTPARTAAIEGLLRYIQGHRDVVFLGLTQLCDWVAARPTAFEEVRI
jgi:peptidoglycan/xylan/chitin deacetylase (PgdA/CDA1 family)